METSQLAERLSALDRAGDGAGGDSGVEELAELVSIAQQVNRLIAITSARFDGTGAFTARSYRSPASFLTCEGRLGQGSARRFVACGRILGHFELLAAAATSGEITFDHVAVFTRLLPASASDHRWACAARDEAELVAAAKTETATAFAQHCVGWRYTVDPDDQVTEQLGRETHGMTVTNLDGGSAELTLRGTAGEIEQLRSAINHATDKAWRNHATDDSATVSDEEQRLSGEPVNGSPGDEAATRRHGDENRDAAARGAGPNDAHGGGTPTDLGDVDSGDTSGTTSRGDGPGQVDGESGPGRSGTKNQPPRGRLQLQATVELVTGSTAAGGGSGRPVVTVVIDWATFQVEAERFATGTAPPVDVFAPGFRCGTIDGHPVPPAEAFLMALRGEIQRCVIGAPSRQIDLGRSQRLFNTAGRHAVRVREGICAHPNCDLPSVWADIDHIDEWQHDGPTDTANAQPLCRFHHVRKHQRQEAA